MIITREAAIKSQSRRIVTSPETLLIDTLELYTQEEWDKTAAQCRQQWEKITFTWDVPPHDDHWATWGRRHVFEFFYDAVNDRHQISDAYEEGYNGRCPYTASCRSPYYLAYNPFVDCFMQFDEYDQYRGVVEGWLDGRPNPEDYKPDNRASLVVPFQPEKVIDMSTGEVVYYN